MEVFYQEILTKEISISFIETLKKCSDELGRITEGEDLGHDNPKLFNAEFLLLLKLNSIQSKCFENIIVDDMNNTLIVNGLWSRHSPEFREKHRLSQNVISHDECNGIAIVDLLIFDGKVYCNQMLSYLSQNNNCYSDKHINVKPHEYFKISPIAYLKDLFSFISALNKNKDNQDKQDDLFPKSVTALRYYRRPRDSAFYKYISNNKLSIVEKIDFHLSWISSLLFYKKGKRNSGTTMTAFKLIALSYSFRVLLPFKIFNNIMTKRLGNKWLYLMCKDYFTNPFHEENEHVITYLSGKINDISTVS